MKKQWVVYLVDKDYEGSTTFLGFVDDLDAFKKFAIEKHGISTDPISDDYGRGSLHYEYTTDGKDYFHLVAEPANKL